jgi:predicted O-methyltransferase YrrM
MNVSDAVFRAIKFAGYKAKAVSAHGLHSPFLFDLYTNIIRTTAHYYAYEKVEALRSKMLLSKKEIAVEDFGTGAAKGDRQMLSLSYIASHYVKPKKYGQLLFRLVNHFKPKTILEIGTSLGLTTLYLALPDESAKVTTLEGSVETAAEAEKNFRALHASNVEIVKGEFSKTLPEAVKRFTHLDFVYFDGNHRKAPTLDYFYQCLGKHSEQSVFVFDDIYWSREMAEAWQEIKRHKAVTVSLDLYSVGIVFFRTGQPKQDFLLKY